MHLEGRKEDSEVKGMGEILMCEFLKAEMALEGGEIPSRLKHYDQGLGSINSKGCACNGVGGVDGVYMGMGEADSAST